MKKIVSIAIVLVISSVLLYSVEKIASFQAFSDGENIVLEWRTVSEDDVENFLVERSSNQQLFEEVSTLSATGKPNFYTYIDEEVFMKPNGEKPLSMNIYKYRLKVEFSDGSYEYSDIINVTHQTSSIRQTWGMIKEMFR